MDSFVTLENLNPGLDIPLLTPDQIQLYYHDLDYFYSKLTKLGITYDEIYHINYIVNSTQMLRREFKKGIQNMQQVVESLQPDIILNFEKDKSGEAITKFLLPYAINSKVIYVEELNQQFDPKIIYSLNNANKILIPDDLILSGVQIATLLSILKDNGLKSREIHIATVGGNHNAYNHAAKLGFTLLVNYTYQTKSLLELFQPKYISTFESIFRKLVIETQEYKSSDIKNFFLSIAIPIIIDCKEKGYIWKKIPDSNAGFLLDEKAEITTHGLINAQEAPLKYFREYQR